MGDDLVTRCEPDHKPSARPIVSRAEKLWDSPWADFWQPGPAHPEPWWVSMKKRCPIYNHQPIPWRWYFLTANPPETPHVLIWNLIFVKSSYSCRHLLRMSFSIRRVSRLTGLTDRWIIPWGISNELEAIKETHSHLNRTKCSADREIVAFIILGTSSPKHAADYFGANNMDDNIFTEIVEVRVAEWLRRWI